MNVPGLRAGLPLKATGFFYPAARSAPWAFWSLWDPCLGDFQASRRPQIPIAKKPSIGGVWLAVSLLPIQALDHAARFVGWPDVALARIAFTLVCFHGFPPFVGMPCCPR